VALTPGETYSFTVTARNTVGNSLHSDPVAILAAKLPDAPLNLLNEPGITTGSQIGLMWSKGLYDGGSPEIDYEVSYTDVTTNVFSVYSSGVLELSDIITGLTPGTTYKFRVRARNIVDFSVYSQEIEITAA
jgi:titin